VVLWRSLTEELVMQVTFPQPEIERALRERDFGKLRREFAGWEPADVAEAIEALDERERAVVFRLLPREMAADVFEHLESEAQEGLIKALGREEVSAVLNDMSPDDRTQLLEEVPASVTKQLLAMLSPDERFIARKLLGYPEDSIGRLMTPDFISIRSDWTVDESLDHIRRHGQDSETLNVINVVDDRGKLIDDLRARELLLAERDARVSDIVDGKFISLAATDDQEIAVQVFKEYDRVAFPVTDSSGILLGIVTVDDVLDVAEEEATEDIHKIGGSVALEHPYMQVGFFDMMRKRSGWLVFLFLGQLLTLNAMGFFAEQIAEAIVLVLFVPLIISSGGNSGSQAATLVVRAMALDEVSLGDWWRVMRREILFGLTLGMILSVIGVGRVALGGALGTTYGENVSEISLVVGLSLILVVLWGVLVGSMLPFMMRGLGFDPAASSTPFVATIADITGLLIYLTLASVIL
jgi:magnesium transporter